MINTISWEQIWTDYGYKIVQVNINIGHYRADKINTVTLQLFFIDNEDSTKTYSMPAGNYLVDPSIEGLNSEEDIYYEFTEITHCNIDQAGKRSNGGEERYAIPITTFERIK